MCSTSLCCENACKFRTSRKSSTMWTTAASTLIATWPTERFLFGFSRSKSASPVGGSLSSTRFNGAITPKRKLLGKEKNSWRKNFRNSWRPSPAKLGDELHLKGGRSVTPCVIHACLCLICKNVGEQKLFVHAYRGAFLLALHRCELLLLVMLANIFLSMIKP